MGCIVIGVMYVGMKSILLFPNNFKRLYIIVVVVVASSGPTFWGLNLEQIWGLLRNK